MVLKIQRPVGASVSVGTTTTTTTSRVAGRRAVKRPKARGGEGEEEEEGGRRRRRRRDDDDEDASSSSSGTTPSSPSPVGEEGEEEEGGGVGSDGGGDDDEAAGGVGKRKQEQKLVATGSGSSPPGREDEEKGEGTCCCCAGCGMSEGSVGTLLLFEDPDRENDRGGGGAREAEGGKEERYCAGCMTGKKVRVFWPVDSRWYIADVVRHDDATGEHLLRYPDGDTEWVRIGEDHTTGAQYEEYSRTHGPALLRDAAVVAGGGNDVGDDAGGLTDGGHAGVVTRMPSFANGVSFALSAMSQSFGMATATSCASAEEGGAVVDVVIDDSNNNARLGGGMRPSQGQRLFQQLNLDRTASSMSSFGMYGGGGGGDPGRAGGGGVGGGHGHAPGGPPPFQILSPNFTHSFSSKIGNALSMEFGPPSHTPPAHHRHHHLDGGARGDAVPPGSGGGGGGGHRPWPAPSGPAGLYPNYYDDGGVGGGQHRDPSTMYPYHHHPGRPSSYPLPDQRHSQSPGGRPSSGGSSREPQWSSSSSSKAASTKGSTDFAGGGLNGKSRKALAKAWTQAEDEHLLDLVLQMQHPLKWSVIAQSMSDYALSKEGADDETLIRSGKQCRERYVNHLNPRLKNTEFTALEDATIWRLYATVGTQWAKMSKVIPGRTDNNLKNRFHNLKRQLLREEDSRLRAPEPLGYAELVHAERVREIPHFLRTKIDDMWNYRRNIGLVAAGSVHEESATDEAAPAEESPSAGEATAAGECFEPRTRRFGPFEVVSEPAQCGRCGLLAPSVQCGNEICARTRWCRVCTRVSMHLAGNVLRECMNLRKIQDAELAGGVNKLMNDIWNGL